MCRLLYLSTFKLAGPSIGFADLMVWPWFERLPAIEIFRDMQILSSDRFPKISAWSDQMRSHKTIASTGYSTDLYVQFYKSRDFNGLSDNSELNVTIWLRESYFL